MKTDERLYLNTFLIWGARQYDPANTEFTKSVKREHRAGIRRNLIMPRKPTSRHLSMYVSNYQT